MAHQSGVGTLTTLRTHSTFPLNRKVLARRETRSASGVGRRSRLGTASPWPPLGLALRMVLPPQHAASPPAPFGRCPPGGRAAQRGPSLACGSASSAFRASGSAAASHDGSIHAARLACGLARGGVHAADGVAAGAWRAPVASVPLASLGPASPAGSPGTALRSPSARPTPATTPKPPPIGAPALPSASLRAGLILTSNLSIIP